MVFNYSSRVGRQEVLLMKWFNFDEISSWRAVVWSVVFVVGMALMLSGRKEDIPDLLILCAPFLAGLGFAPDKVKPK